MKIRNFKKVLKLCEDDNGKAIYPGDVVRICIGWEVDSPYESIVYWDSLHGAFVEEHPTYKVMGSENMRPLYHFLNKQKLLGKVTSCIKIKSFKNINNLPS